MTWITIASIQPPFYEEKSLRNNGRSIAAGFAFLEQAMQKGVAFCCLPEFFNVFGVPERDTAETSANWEDLLRRAQALAAEYSAFVILPMLVREQGQFLNRAYLVDDVGKVAGTYDKVHLTLGEREVFSLVPGHEIRTFDTRYGRIAIATCYDFYFPELFAALARSEPDLIFLPSLQRSEHEMASEAMLKTRAMDTQSYVVRSSFGRESTAPWRKDLMFGQSCVVHPDGSFLANAGHYEGVALAYIRVPFDWQRARCGGYPCQSVRAFLAEDRRPDLYNAPPGESLAPSANG